MPEQSVKPMRRAFLLLAIAGAFLCDPWVGFIDYLPDVLGCFFLLLGLLTLTDLSDILSDCFEKCRALFFVSAAQAAGEWLVHLYLPNLQTEPNEYELPIRLLLFSFVFALLKLCFLLPALRLLFVGIEELSGKTNLRSEHTAKALQKLSVVGVLLSVLPEAVSIPALDQSKKTEGRVIEWLRFQPLFRLVCAAIGVCVAVAFLLYWVRFFRNVRKDEKTVSFLDSRYQTEVAPKVGLFRLRRLNFTFLLFVAALFFTVPLRLDGYRLLPGCVAGVLILLGTVLSAQDLSHPRVNYASSLLLCGVGVAEQLLSDAYLKDLEPDASLYQTEAYYRYLSVQICDAAEAIVASLTLAAMLLSLRALILELSLVDYGEISTKEQNERATRRKRRPWLQKLFALLFLTASAGILEAVEPFLRLSLAWLWWIPTVLTVSSIFLLLSLFTDLKTELSFQKSK